MKKEKIRRIAKRITAFAAAVAMTATFSFPAEIGDGFFDGFGNAIVASAATGAFTVTGGTEGTDYKYENNVLTILQSTTLTISGTTTEDRIEVASGVSANIIFNGVNITSSLTPFKIADNSTGDVTITLADGSVNTLISNGGAGLQKNGGYSDTLGELTIKGGANGTGKLTATGGEYSAGIGAGNSISSSCITISGGTVTANGGNCGAGIGGGNRGGPGSYITISGGTVTANGGNCGAGIGGGNRGGPGSYITISGGNVTANGGYNGAGIGGGWHGSCSNIEISGGTVTATGYGAPGIGRGVSGTCDDGTIVIKGGSVKANLWSKAADGSGNYVYKLTIANPDSKEVFIDGTSYTPVNHKALDSNDGNLYVFLPTRTIDDPLEVKVGTETTQYYYDTVNSKWVMLNGQINSVAIDIEEPTAGSAFATSASVTSPATGIETITSSDIVWKDASDSVVSGTAGYNKEYTVYVTLKASSVYTFKTDVGATVNTNSPATVSNNTGTEITVKYTFNKTPKAKLISITNPNPITKPNGTAKTSDALGLPSTVDIVTEDTSVTSADVTWDVNNASYDPSVLTEQTFTVNGTVTLPTEIDDNNVSLNVTISVTVSAADTVADPTASPVSGTYTENQSVVLSCATQGAAIYYTTDGTDPTASSTQYTAPISVTGTEGQSVTTTIKAIAVKSGMLDSGAATFTYTIEIPAATHTITATAGAGGSISPSGSVTVADNDSQTFTITPNNGYKIDTLKVDGNAVTATKSYTFTNVTDNHTISVTFKQSHTHSYGTEWKTDSTSHWHECSCGDKTDVELHTEDSGTVTIEPTETTEGVKTYKCVKCEYVMRTETIPPITPEHTHEYGTEWKSDSTSHWHECSCGDKTDIGQHISNGGVVTVQPTATSTGVRTYSCRVCGRVIGTETIPATGLKNNLWYYIYPTFPTTSANPGYTVSESVFTEKLTVKAVTDGDMVILSWNKIGNADKYNVYQFKNGKYVSIKSTANNSVSLKGLKNGESYQFLVRYVVDGKLSPMAYSNKFTVKVCFKPYPKAIAEKNSIKLSWRAVPKAEKYAIYKYVDGKAVKLAEVNGKSVKINKLSSDTEYSYIVRAYVDGEWTPMYKSDVVTVKTLAE